MFDRYIRGKLEDDVEKPQRRPTPLWVAFIVGPLILVVAVLIVRALIS